MHQDLASLVVISIGAAFVPLLVGLFRIRVAEVVFLLAFGIVAGPHVLNWIHITESVRLLSELGLGLLFFLAGYEVERRSVTGLSGKLAALGWLISLGVASVVAVVATRLDWIHDTIGVTIALTTTALGTLLPIVRDANLLHTRFGQFFMGAGAWGEFGPIVAIAILLGTKSKFFALVTLLTFALIAVILWAIPAQLRNERINQVIAAGHKNSAQTGLRLTILLLLVLLSLASGFGIDAVLGAFVAGVIVRRLLPDSEDSILRPKMEALAFGFFVPLFFIVSGANLDIQSIAQHPLRLLLFFALLLVVRGVPQYLLYAKALPQRQQRKAFALLCATALPLLVAITQLQVTAGEMCPETAAALVGAGALSVLVFPLAASAQLRKSSMTPAAHAGQPH